MGGRYVYPCWWLELTPGSSKRQAELPSTLALQSSSTLGSGKTSSAQERLENIEDQEVRHAIRSRQRKGGRFADIAESDSDEENNAHNFHSEHDQDQQGGEDASPRGQTVVLDSASIAARRRDVSVDVVIGSALQRNVDGSIMKPRIMKKRDKNTSVCPISPPFFVLGSSRF